MPTPSPDHPVVLFDGVCTLCSASVRWIIARDRHVRFRFASLQSQAARLALADAGKAPSPTAVVPLDSIVVIIDGRVRTRSDAVLAIARVLGFPWSFAVVCVIIPRPIRDALYGVVARNRYRWFGHRDTCMIPTPELRARFLDADEC